MAQNSSAVIVPGHGRFWLAPVDTLAPGQVLKVTGAPTQATLTLTVNAVVLATPVVLRSTDSVYAKALAIANALASLSTVGGGNVVAVLPTADPWTFTIILDPSVTVPAITVTGAFTGGATPAVTVSSTGRSADFSAFTEIGHTSQDNPCRSTAPAATSPPSARGRPTPSTPRPRRSASRWPTACCSTTSRA
jgi:hypothetical protein